MFEHSSRVPQHEFQADLMLFVRTEISLAQTMLMLARTTGDADRRTRVWGNILTTVRTVQRFSVRIADSTVRDQISRSMELLVDHLDYHRRREERDFGVAPAM